MDRLLEHSVTKKHFLIHKESYIDFILYYKRQTYKKTIYKNVMLQQTDGQTDGLSDWVKDKQINRGTLFL